MIEDDTVYVSIFEGPKRSDATWREQHALDCGLCRRDCLDACFNQAISAVTGGIIIHQAQCAGCGACLGACQSGHIRLEHGVARQVG